MSQQSHKGQILPLVNTLIPISQNTTFHASYDRELYGLNQGQKVSPCGYISSLKFSSAKAENGAAYIPGLPSGATARTLECWVYSLSNGAMGSPGIIGYPYAGNSSGATGNAFEITYSTSGDSKFGVHVWGGIYLSTNTFAINTWYHIAATYDGTTLKLYVNGNLENTTTVALSTTVNTGTYNFNIHNSVNPADGARACSISDVRVWNYARTQQQVQASMNAELTGSETGLLAYWKLNDGQGLNFGDSSMVGSDGVIRGGATWGDGRIIATLRSDGKFGGAVAIEEGTTNHILATSNGETASVFGSDGVGVTMVMQEDYALYGTKSMRWTYGTSGSANWYANAAGVFSTTTSTVWTFSCYVRRADGKDVTGLGAYIYFGNTGGIPATITPAGNGWFRVVATRTAATAAAVTLAGLYGMDTTVSWFFDGFQLETKAFAGSYVSGSRPASVLSYPKEVINPNSFTFNAWIKLNGLPSQAIATDSRPIFEVMHVGGGMNRIQLCFLPNDSGYGLWIGTDTSNYNPALTTITHTVGQWRMVTASYNGTTYKLYLDGQLKASSAQVAAVLNPSATLNIGGKYMGNLNGLIEEVRIDKVAVSDDEVLAWYTANAPFYNYLDYTGVIY